MCQRKISDLIIILRPRKLGRRKGGEGGEGGEKKGGGCLEL